MSLARQRKQRNAFVHIVAAGFLMPGQVTLAAVKLVAPLRGHTAVEGIGNGTVQLVDIDRLQALTQPVALGAQTHHRLVMVAPLDLEAGPERLNDEIVNLFVEAQLCQQPTKLLFEHFLTHEFLRAFPAEAGAVIVDVFPLLDLSRDGATTMTAAYQPGEGELANTPAGLGMTGLVVATVEDVLNTCPEILRDQCVMAPLIDLASPFELAGVETAPQDFMDSADRNRASALAVGKPFLAGQRTDLLQGVAARRIPLEQAPDEHPLLGIGDDGLLAVRSGDIQVSERCGAGP
nr:hypothetical protein [Sphingobium sp.]